MNARLNEYITKKILLFKSYGRKLYQFYRCINKPTLDIHIDISTCHTLSHIN